MTSQPFLSNTFDFEKPISDGSNSPTPLNDSDLRTILSSNGHAAELSLSEPGSNINSLVLLHLK